MTLPILEQAVEAVPDVSFRLRDFLASRVSRPIPEPVQDAPAAEAEAPAEVPQCDRQEDPGSEDEGHTPAGETAEADAEAGQ